MELSLGFYDNTLPSVLPSPLWPVGDLDLLIFGVLDTSPLARSFLSKNSWSNILSGCRLHASSNLEISFYPHRSEKRAMQDKEAKSVRT